MILTYIKGYKRYLSLGLLSGIISSFILSFIPSLYSNIIGLLVNNNIDNLSNLLLLYLSYNIYSNIFAGIRGTIFSIFIELVINKLKKNILLNYFNKDLIYYNNKNNNDISNILISDSLKFGDIYLLNCNVFIRNFIQFITISYILIPRSILLFFITLSLSITHIFIEKFYNHFIYEKISNDTNDILNKQNNLISDYISKIETYRSLYLENTVYNKWIHFNSSFLNMKIKNSLCYGINLFIIQSLNELFMVIIILLGIYFKYTNDIILIFVLYKSSFTNIVKDINEIRRNFISNKKAISNINDFFNNNNNLTLSNTFIPSSNFNPNIYINNLTFSYDNNTNIFTNFNLVIRKNIITGFKGKSGFGKSTLFKLILGFYNSHIINGHINFDNVNINLFDKTFFYNNIISYVGQEPILFNGSIKENLFNHSLSFNNDLFNDIFPLIEDFYNDNNDSDLIKLSGGQKQRLCICRALLKNTKILLLDEPTSALDSDNILKFINIINKLSTKYKITILLISHDDDLLKICNQIIYI
jgi:ABC-type branched-subunit amino acid transport system ATPase component